MPNILNFENKRAYFKKEIDNLKRNSRQRNESIHLHINRKDIFMDAYQNLNFRRDDIKGKLVIQFT